MVRYAVAALALAFTSLGLSARGAEPQIVMLDFWSPQCGPCMQMKPVVHSLEQARYPIREIDTTHDFQTSRQFNVDRIPCFVMLVDGREVDREVGYTSSERLQQMFQKANDVFVQTHRMRGQSPDSTVAQPQSVGGNSSTGPAPRPEPAPTVPQQLPATPVGFGRAPGQLVPPQSTGNDFPPSLMAATVRIRVEDAQGRSCGTGTIIDTRSGDALIVTCGHLFRDSKGKGPITVEMFAPGPGGLQVVAKVPGQLISYDLERDVAFVSMHPNRQVTVATVAPPHTQIIRGDRVATIGCSNGNDPTLLPQRINMLDRYQGPPNIEVSGAPEEGRSGGGLFNLQGQLIGVCYAADYEGKEGLYTALETVQGELNRLHLQDVYAKTPSSKPLDASGNSLAANQSLVVRGQELSQGPVTSLAESTPRSPIGSKAPPQNLSETEQAALSEVMQRAAKSEVVVIVRPKTPGGQSEVITLDDVSPEFVQALEAQRKNPPKALTR